MKTFMTKLDTLFAAAAMAEGGLPDTAREMVAHPPSIAKPTPAQSLREEQIRPPSSPAAQPVH